MLVSVSGKQIPVHNVGLQGQIDSMDTPKQHTEA